jgi:hypothetical protein
MEKNLCQMFGFAAFLAASSCAQGQTADSAQRFSPFDFGQGISIGLSLDYFHYNEIIDMSDDIQSFKEHYGSPPQIIGAPKSTEYGTDVGICGSAAFYSWRSRLFVRPRAELQLGIGNTYDGSSQREYIVDSPGDTTGLLFSSYKGKKNNFLIFAGCDAGYALPFFKSPVVLYTGIDFLWWYRDLTPTFDNTYYFGTPGSVETYSRFALPVGLLCVKPVSSEIAVGLDARVDWMFYGTMKNDVTTGSGDSTVVYPAVTLGDFPTLRIEVFMVDKANDHAAWKFSPYLLFYGFGKSNTDVSTNQQAFFEPSSRSFWLGCTVSLEFYAKRFR